MEDVMRRQLMNARSAYARRAAAAAPAPVAPPAPTLPAQAAAQAGAALGAAPAWTISPPGRPAPAHEFNFEPVGDGSWRVFPPGVQAPPWGPQGSMPTMASHEHLRGMGGDMRQMFGGGGTPETPEQAQARLSALPGRRVGQYRRAGLEPPPPPGWANRGAGGTGGEGEGDGGDDGTGGTGGGGGTNPAGHLTGPGPYIPGIPTIENPHEDEQT